jgi:ABC-type multidrug transport system ATPase subunit
MPAAPFLSVLGFSKSFGRLAAISDISFSIGRGEVLGLIGPNGAGKTTLFECLAGVRPASRGRLVTTAGVALSLADRSSVIFYVPDGIRPYPDQSVAWVLDFTLGYFGGDPRRRPHVIEALGLAPLLAQPLGTLSKGQAKRALLAMGLLTPQPILMIDEPFDGLDLRQTREAAAALRRFSAEGRTLFLSIHQIADAARVCDRLVLLSGGTIRGEGTASELAARAEAPDLEGAFLALT